MKNEYVSTQNVIAVVNVLVRENSVVCGNEGGGGPWNGVTRVRQVKELKLHPGCRGSFQVYEEARTKLPAKKDFDNTADPSTLDH